MSIEPRGVTKIEDVERVLEMDRKYRSAAGERATAVTIPIINLNSREQQGSITIQSGDSNHIATLMAAGMQVKLEAEILRSKDGTHSLQSISFVWDGCEPQSNCPTDTDGDRPSWSEIATPPQLPEN